MHGRTFVAFSLTAFLGAGSFVSVALAQTAPSATAQTPPASVDATASPKPVDKLVCRNMTEPGSLITKRVCEPQSVIDQEQENADRMLNRLQSPGTTGQSF